ncbi:MAG: inositol 2-dehydrogenase [Rhodospirillales bacterium]|nr:MAG: inositol 2-dehydrogenase [Rhodospirillales bacterium]
MAGPRQGDAPVIEICQFGAGRIGRVHAANIAAHPGARLRYVVDVDNAAAAALAAAHGAEATDAESALADPDVSAIVIASSTDTHVGFIEAGARAGKAIFCEKPIHLDLRRVDACLSVLDECNASIFVGFNRRFDPSFAALKSAVREGQIGRVEMVSITSRDPAPPPIDYIKVSGGLFRDMMIHDFDMARWLLDEEPAEVFATGSCLVDPAIGAAGDIDTALVTLKAESGALCQISNSRRAVYGYDQRIEVLGARGMLRAENRLPTSVEHATADGIRTDPPLHFFLERYEEAYKRELASFLDAVAGGKIFSPGGEDGRAAQALAEAAVTSFESGNTVRV